MRNYISISLILLFTGILISPVFPADKCDMPCCQIIVPCCEIEETLPDCSSMVKGQETLPVTLPTALLSAVTKVSYNIISTAIVMPDLNNNETFDTYFEGSSGNILSQFNIPLFLITNSLLI